MNREPDELQGLPANPQRGAVIAGKYQLEHELGRGAMGTVWAALHLSLGQRVAIKLIAREHVASPELVERFSVEAKAAASLRSRYAVQIFDDGQTADGTPYIVMEYLEGESLEERLRREGEIGLLDAVRIVDHVARALTQAHARGIVHRDLKPGNIFLARSNDEEQDWVAKVVDFGIAKVTTYRGKHTTQSDVILGTPLYMSPEQIRGAGAVDHRADLYSLGMVCYNMLTGKCAFEEDTFGGLLVSICTAPLPSLLASLPDAPPALDSWFQRACARDPDRRYQTADAFAEALSKAVGIPIGLRKSSAAEETDERVDSRDLNITAVPQTPLTPQLAAAPQTLSGASGESTLAPRPRSRSAWTLTLALIGVVTVGASAWGAWASHRDTNQRQESTEPTLALDPEAPPGELPEPKTPAQTAKDGLRTRPTAGDEPTEVTGKTGEISAASGATSAAAELDEQTAPPVSAKKGAKRGPRDGVPKQSPNSDTDLGF